MARRDSPGLTAGEGRKFAWTLAGAFLALAALFWWRGHGWLLGVAAGLASALFLLGLLVPGRLEPVHRAWMALARAISVVTTPIFLGVVHFLVLTPFGLARRLVGGNPLVREARDGSYWVERSDGGARTDMERQF